jgi:hypothetical protein
MPERQFDVFLSYSSTDRAWVVELKQRLEERRLHVWLDVDEIRGGDLFVDALERALEASRTMILIVSPESVGSGWVTEEYSRAMSLAAGSEALRIIPLLLRDAPLPGFLRSRHRIDFRNEDEYERSLSELVFGITGIKPTEQLIRGTFQKVLVDRRIATEMLMLFSQAASQVHVDPRTGALLVAASAVYVGFLIENLYGSTLAGVVKRSEALQQRVTFIPPVETSGETGELFDDIVDAWAGHPEFRVLAATYEQRKGGSASATEAAEYILRVLASASQLGTGILVHPERWPLFRWCIERAWRDGESRVPVEVVDVPLSPSDPRIVPARRHAMQTMADALQPKGNATLFRFGPMMFPVPQEVAQHYDAETLPSAKTTFYEICAPHGEDDD